MTTKFTNETKRSQSSAKIKKSRNHPNSIGTQYVKVKKLSKNKKHLNKPLEGCSVIGSNQNPATLETSKQVWEVSKKKLTSKKQKNKTLGQT